jgi:peptide/nickel transport system substrate-binding protein
MDRQLRSPRRGLARILTLLVLGVLLITACTPTAPAGQSAAPGQSGLAAPKAAKPAGPTGTLTIAQLALLPRADPYGVTANAEHSIVYSVWDPLTRVDEDGTAKNYLAESWENESPTAWIVKLRKGVVWHDGSPFTAKDVAFSIDRIRDPACKCIWNTAYNYVTGSDIIDDFTIRIKTASMQVGLPVDFGRVAMIPKDAWERMGEDAYFQNPVGTGPFKLTKISPGESWTLEANENYFLGAPKVKTLVWKQIKDPATRVAELLSGASDIVIGLPPNELQRIDASPNAQTVVGPSVIRVMMDFPMSTTPALQDKRVREAAVLAVNVDAINNATYGGKAGKQNGHFDKHTAGYNKDSKAHPYDPARAKQLLTEAGFPDGLALPLMMPRGGFLLDDEVALAVVDYLNKAGFKIDFQPLDFGTYSSMRLKSEYKGLQLASTRNTTGDPDQIMRSYDPKRQDKYLLDKTLEGLIDAQAGEANREKRNAAVVQLDKYMHENFMAYNMMTVPSLDGINKRVKGFKQSPFETYSFNEVGVE